MRKILSLLTISFFISNAFVFTTAPSVAAPVASYRKKTAPRTKREKFYARLMKSLPEVALVAENASPKVTVTIFFAIECEHCAKFDKEIFPRIKEKYIDTGKIKFVYKDFPLSKLGLKAAQLAWAFGPENYLELAMELLNNQNILLKYYKKTMQKGVWGAWLKNKQARKEDIEAAEDEQIKKAIMQALPEIENLPLEELLWETGELEEDPENPEGYYENFQRCLDEILDDDNLEQAILEAQLAATKQFEIEEVPVFLVEVGGQYALYKGTLTDKQIDDALKKAG